MLSTAAMSGRKSWMELANSWHRKTYFNLKQIVHSLNLRSPLFRLDWCGNYSPSPRRTFHSSRRSGSVLVLFCYRKRTKPPRLWAEWNYTCLVTPSTRKVNCVVFIFLNRFAPVILNKVKELSCYESKIVLKTTKVPQLLKGRFRDDICFKF
jgi:hypothetical protein